MAVWENGGYLAENGVVFLSQLFPTILPNLALEMVTPNVGEDMHDPCRISIGLTVQHFQPKYLSIILQGSLNYPFWVDET